uniref:Phytocyanin domain-containing protein n=1 Tax=Kalanchoe fedtschenkoi TaxID=63787 RepID=A0A7N0RAB8_KALFE
MRGLAAAALLLASMLAVADANLFTVGWAQRVNYTDWASGKRFYVGDWLKFVFTKYQYSVLEVNQTSYENCVEADFITNITRGGRDVFQLNYSRPYYFISGYGQCWGGVKLAINVEDIPPPQPSPPKSAATSVESQVSTLLMMFLIWAFILILVDF